jgi:hypothetical protein
MKNKKKLNNGVNVTDEMIHQEYNLVGGILIKSTDDSPTEKLCRMNQNFICNCIDNTICPNF